MATQKNIKRVAVLGAGVMGAQIAAHCVNARVPVVLFDLPTAEDKNKSAIAATAIEKLKKMKPSPLGLAEDTLLIQAANYEDHLHMLSGCDLIIEAIAERMDWKHALYEKVSPHLPPQAIFATNTSGLPIDELSQGFSNELKKRFCGVHFFNPPRYMHLLELIPGEHTDPTILDALEGFMTSTLGKGVVRAKDTPNFIGNRIGVFSILAIFAEAEKYQLAYDTVDAITGSKLGRAKSATFRTSDVVGLDTMAHVIKTMEGALQSDPFSHLFKVPDVVNQLITKGHLGEKTKSGFYRKDGKSILVFDAKTQEYKLSTGTIEPLVERILKKPIAERLELLRTTDDPQAQFLWSIFRDIFHYSAYHLETISNTAREIDFAMRWGYGWNSGPFEEWQSAGWLKLAHWIKEDIEQGKSLCNAPLPDWVFNSEVSTRGAIHTADGSWSASAHAYLAKSQLPAYQKQIFRAPLDGDGSADPRVSGTTVVENPEIRIWVEDSHPEVLILSFKSKMNTISPTVLTGIQDAVAIAEEKFSGLVIWQPTSLKLGTPGGPFSAGANLEAALPLVMANGPKGVEPFVQQFQDTMMRVKYAQVPVVTAISGIALGGGCELILHSSKRVAAIESYIGLVEVGVGLLPAGGGLKEAAIRASRLVQSTGHPNYLDFIRSSFENAAMARVSGSAHEAIKMAYLKPDDVIVANVYELLAQAQQQVMAMSYAGYRPPIQELISVGGRSVASTVMGQLVNMRDGGFISDHDAHIAKKIIDVISGGDVDAGTQVTEQWLLKLERQAFVELIGHPKTMERIMGMLQTGKPVRN